MEGKDIPDRSKYISKMVRKKETTSGSFKNGQFGDVTHCVLGPHFYSVGQRFSQCVQSNPGVPQKLQGPFQQGGGVGLGIGPGSERHP